MYPKTSPLVALLLQVTFTLYAFYRSYPRGLLVAESKEYIYIYIYGEEVDFCFEIIVENYEIFLIVSLLAGYRYNFS